MNLLLAFWIASPLLFIGATWGAFAFLDRLAGRPPATRKRRLAKT